MNQQTVKKLMKDAGYACIKTNTLQYGINLYFDNEPLHI